jgi:hypothetical protein
MRRTVERFCANRPSTVSKGETVLHDPRADRFLGFNASARSEDGPRRTVECFCAIRRRTEKNRRMLQRDPKTDRAEPLNASARSEDGSSSSVLPFQLDFTWTGLKGSTVRIDPRADRAEGNYGGSDTAAASPARRSMGAGASTAFCDVGRAQRGTRSDGTRAPVLDHPGTRSGAPGHRFRSNRAPPTRA